MRILTNFETRPYVHIAGGHSFFCHLRSSEPAGTFVAIAAHYLPNGLSLTNTSQGVALEIPDGSYLVEYNPADRIVMVLSEEEFGANFVGIESGSDWED